MRIRNLLWLLGGVLAFALLGTGIGNDTARADKEPDGNAGAAATPTESLTQWRWYQEVRLPKDAAKAKYFSRLDCAGSRPVLIAASPLYAP